MSGWCRGNTEHLKLIFWLNGNMQKFGNIVHKAATTDGYELVAAAFRTYMDFLHKVTDVYSKPLTKINGTLIYTGVNKKLFTKELEKIVNEKARIFKKKLSHAASIHDIVGELTGYEVISTEKDCGGYCDIYNKEIAINEPFAMFHEISHYIQAELCILEPSEKVMSKNILMEQQAETIAYYLYNATHPGKPLGADKFNAYTTREDFDFLRKWYDGYYEDDLL